MSVGVAGRRAGNMSDVFFVEGLVAVGEIRTGLPSLVFPKSIALSVARVDEHTRSVDAFRPESITSRVCQLLSETLALVLGQNHGMVDITASAVMPGKDASDYLSGNFNYKAGAGVAPEKFADAFFAVVQAS